MHILFKCLSRQGFTFNELLVAMNVMVIGVLGLSMAMVAVIRGNKGNDNFAVAVNLAHDKIEQLKASNNLTTENRCPGGGDSGINSSGAGGGIFDRCWRITPSALGTQLKQVDVTVSWREPETHEITLSTLIFTDEPL
jgi:Tfp pilus assembly protein PilV